MGFLMDVIWWLLLQFQLHMEHLIRRWFIEPISNLIRYQSLPASHFNLLTKHLTSVFKD